MERQTVMDIRRRLHALRWLIPLAVALRVSSVNAQSTTDLALLDRLQHVYHGVPVDKALQTLSIPAAGLHQTQQLFIQRYASAKTPLQHDQLTKLSVELGRQQLLTPYVRLALSGTEADLVAADNSPAKLGAYAWKLDYLRTFASTNLTDTDWPTVQPRLLAYLTSVRYATSNPELWSVLRRWVESLDKPNAYTSDCAAQKVPVPPDWTSGLWTRQGSVATSALFLSLGSPVEVYTYANGEGSCIALPRWGLNGDSVTLGVICQNKNNGKACFWDNRTHAGKQISVARLSTTSIARDWVNGYDEKLVGGGKCTMCHRGDNVFALHRDGVLSRELPISTQTAVRYEPLTSFGWTNPPATPLSGAGCTSCHSIGSVADLESASYCAMLKKASSTEMPSRAMPSGWTSPQPLYAPHINRLKTFCGP